MPPPPIEGIVAELFARGGLDQRAVEIECGDLRPPPAAIGGIVCEIVLVVTSDQQCRWGIVVNASLGPVDWADDFGFLGGGSEEVCNGSFCRVELLLAT